MANEGESGGAPFLFAFSGDCSVKPLFIGITKVMPESACLSAFAKEGGRIETNTYHKKISLELYPL